jgi:hypothetical protein
MWHIIFLPFAVCQVLMPPRRKRKVVKTTTSNSKNDKRQKTASESVKTKLAETSSHATIPSDSAPVQLVLLVAPSTTAAVLPPPVVHFGPIPAENLNTMLAEIPNIVSTNVASLPPLVTQTGITTIPVLTATVPEANASLSSSSVRPTVSPQKRLVRASAFRIHKSSSSSSSSAPAPSAATVFPTLLHPSAAIAAPESRSTTSHFPVTPTITIHGSTDTHKIDQELYDPSDVDTTQPLEEEDEQTKNELPDQVQKEADLIAEYDAYLIANASASLSTVPPAPTLCTTLAATGGTHPSVASSTPAV